MANLMQQRVLFVCMAVVAVVASIGRSTAQEANDKTTKVFVGYVYGLPEDINYGLYTHLCHAFIVADEDGRLKPNPRVPSNRFAEQAHAAGVKVLLSLGGWGWDNEFAAMVKKSVAEARYIEAVMRLVDEFDYDGIDLDWEYPDTAEEVVGFERLAGRFRAQLDELGRRKDRPMLITMAASAQPETLKWLDPEFLLANFEWINVMTYDYAGEWSPRAAHHSPLFASPKLPPEDARSIERTMTFLVDEQRLPAERLTVGLPLYGRGFAAAEPYGPVERSAPRRGGDFARLHELHTKQGWKREWDDETKNPWLIAPDGSTVIGYDDAESLAIKTGWAMKQGFRGVFFWQIAGDHLPDGSNPLQEAARKKLTSK